MCRQTEFESQFRTVFMRIPLLQCPLLEISEFSFLKETTWARVIVSQKLSRDSGQTIFAARHQDVSQGPLGRTLLSPCRKRSPAEGAWQNTWRIKSSGKEKTHKHKQICGIVPGLDGCQKVVYVFFFGSFLMGEKKHINKIPPKIPGQSRENFVYVSFSLCVFVAP